MASLPRKLMSSMVLCVFIIIVVQNKICMSEKQTALFIFGDSLFDVGNNNNIRTVPFLQANIAPYGHTFFQHATGRFSDGLVVPDFIAEYAGLPLLPPYLHAAASNDGGAYCYGVNFASAGAGALVETHPGTAIDLKTQVSDFEQVSKVLKKKLGNAEAKALLSNAVYIFSIGGNDYSAPFLTTSDTVVLPYPQQQFVDVVIGNISSVIQVYMQKIFQLS